MSQTSHLKSAQITALDTYQPGGDLQSAGFGAPARSVTVAGTVTTVSADAAGSTYQMVRVPTNASIKYIGFSAKAMGAGTMALSVYYSDSKIDGTAAANQAPTVERLFPELPVPVLERPEVSGRAPMPPADRGAKPKGKGRKKAQPSLNGAAH